MRYHAIAIILLMIGSILSGCIGDDASTDDDVDDTAENIDGTINETVNQTTNDTAGNETTDGGNGTTNNTVQYVGFLDNTTVAGYQMNPGGNFSNLGLMDTQRCTDISNGLGFMKDGFCILDYGMMFNFTEAAWVTSLEINETEGCVELYVNDTSEGCLQNLGNISISGRVMWKEYLDHKEGPDGLITTSHCLVYIESPAFVSSSQYNRTHNSSSSGVNWDELWADPAYVQWENERMSAYSVEEANAPSWCTTPQFDALYWLTSPADTTPDPEPVQYVGFLDNSSAYGYRMNQGENFTRIFIPINEENCTTTGSADWLGVWDEPFCVQDYGVNEFGANYSYNETLACLSVSNETGHIGCWGNMSISGRVMWYGWDVDVCAVFISSEQFTPMNGFNLTGVPMDWDQLWGDSAYMAWEAERMAAYSAEVGNQPGWCPDPMLNFYWWASQPAS